MKPTSILIALGIYLAYKVGKEAAYEEVREAFGIEAEDDLAQSQREVAHLQ